MLSGRVLLTWFMTNLEQVIVMKIKNQIVICLVIILTSISINSYAEETLYRRLGGYDALAAVVDNLMGRLANDKQVGRVLEHIPDSRFQPCKTDDG